MRFLVKKDSPHLLTACCRYATQDKATEFLGYRPSFSSIYLLSGASIYLGVTLTLARQPSGG